MLSMIQQEVVEKHHWMTAQQVTDMIAISQMTPGPIAINVATFIGFQQAGYLGAVFTTIGVILPSMLLMLLITLFYLKLRGKSWFSAILKELRPLVVGLIVAAAWLTAKASFVDWFGIAVFLGCFILSLKFKLNPLVLMLLAGIAGIIAG